MNTTSNDDKVYSLYYTDVGKYSTLKAVEERRLFERYRTCSGCKVEIPLEVLRVNCPSCGVSINHNTNNARATTCVRCEERFDVYEPPQFCLKCGTARDVAARNTIIESNLRFVVKKASKLCKDVTKLKALISAGNIGLVVAVDKFNYKRGHRFLTYASWWIQKEMYDAINTSALIHIPAFKRKELMRATKEGKYVCQHCGIRTDVKSHSLLPPCTEEEHLFIDTTKSKSNILVGGGVPIDTVNVTNEETPEGDLIDDSMKDTLREAVRESTLSPREKYILFGYYDAAQPDRKSDPKNLGQLSVMVGVTPERIRQLKTNALEKIRRKMRLKAVRQSADISV